MINRPFVQVQIFGKFVVALLGSGAKHSCIRGPGLGLLNVPVLL